MFSIRDCFSGTKWCGKGNRARNYDDLGEADDTDRCCRAHDKAPGGIKTGQTVHNITNKFKYTMWANFSIFEWLINTSDRAGVRAKPIVNRLTGAEWVRTVITPDTRHSFSRRVIRRPLKWNRCSCILSLRFLRGNLIAFQKALRSRRRISAVSKKRWLQSEPHGRDGVLQCFKSEVLRSRTASGVREEIVSITWSRFASFYFVVNVCIVSWISPAFDLSDHFSQRRTFDIKVVFFVAADGAVVKDITHYKTSQKGGTSTTLHISEVAEL